MSDRGCLVSIGGEVGRPVCLGIGELRSLIGAELVEDFHCREDGADSARLVTVACGDYTAVLTREPDQATARRSRSPTTQPAELAGRIDLGATLDAPHASVVTDLESSAGTIS